jgi:hypothetical protein
VSADEPLPLDPRWRPEREVLERLVPHFVNTSIARHEITLALREGMGCLNVFYDPVVGTWVCRRVSFLCWQMIEWAEVAVNRFGGWRPPFPITGSASVRSILEPPPSLGTGVVFWQRGLGQRGSALYFWLPYLEQRWLTVFPPMAQKYALPKPGSASAWIDVVAPNGAWRNLTGKGLHSLVAQHIDDLNAKTEQDAKKQSRKSPPKIKCPGVRAFQTAVAKRHRREQQDQAQ